MEPSFHCCASCCVLTKEMAVKAGIKRGGDGFIGTCPTCHKQTMFLSSPEPNQLVMENIEEFGAPIPGECPHGHQKKVERWGLNFRCTECNFIFSA